MYHFYFILYTFCYSIEILNNLACWAFWIQGPYDKNPHPVWTGYFYFLY